MVHQMDWLVCRNHKSFGASRSNDAAGEDAVTTFACEIMLNMNGVRGNEPERESPVREHPGAFGRRRKTRMNGIEKGQREDPAKGPSSVVNDGSSAWIRTRNPPVNRRKKKR
jgi:hypothetical protein